MCKPRRNTLSDNGVELFARIADTLYLELRCTDSFGPCQATPTQPIPQSTNSIYYMCMWFMDAHQTDSHSFKSPALQHWTLL